MPGSADVRELLVALGRYRAGSLDHWYLLPGVFLLLAGIAWKAPEGAVRSARRMLRLPRRVSRSLVFGIFAAAAFVVAAGAIFLAGQGFPSPAVHDEFSYLLAADTFARGRLTNPTHPLWVHFETFHVNMLPSYASMYPPGQGLILAAGTLVFGHPWFGVWLSAMLLSMAVCWALRGWLPPEWALPGGLMAATLGCLSYWMTSYWGGALAAAGGALVLGAWPRLERKPSVGNALLFSLGAAILACTRVYEGAVLTAAAGMLLARSAIRRPVAPARVYLTRVLLPAVIAALAASSWMMFYFWRVTGDATLMPYVLNARTYLHRPLFLWERDRQPADYRHAIMRQLYSAEYVTDRSGPEWIEAHLIGTADHYGGIWLLLPLAGFPFLLRKRNMRGLYAACLAVAVAVGLSSFIRPHYLAPAMAGFIGLALQTLRYLGAWRPSGRRVGAVAVRGVLAVWLIAEWKTGLAHFAFGKPHPWAGERVRIERTLERQAGAKHLIIVRYSDEHNAHREWVYNRADLFGSPVLWAREMDQERNRRLVEFFRDRTIWLLEPDRSSSLAPYPR